MLVPRPRCSKATACGSNRWRASTTTDSSRPPATATSGSCGSPRCRSPAGHAYISRRWQARTPATCCRGPSLTSPAARSSQHAVPRHRPAVDRVEIGYTWYARRCQKTHVNTACKLLLLGMRLMTRLLGRRVPHRQLQFRLAAGDRRARRKEGRRDSPPSGAPRRHVRDTVMFSILAVEWPDVKRT